MHGGPIAPMAEDDYERLRRGDGFALLARLFPDEMSTRALLEDANVALHRLRPYGHLRGDLYWRAACRTIADGAFPESSIAVLLREALRHYPGNAALLALAGEPSRQNSEVRVLCLAAQPGDKARLRLGAEYREIVRETRGSRVVPTIRQAVQYEDLDACLYDARPHILHFSGHGTAGGEILLEDHGGFGHPLGAAALARVLAAFGRLSAIVLGSCHTAAAARPLLAVSDVVVGASGPLHDICALHFTRHLYRGVAAGEPVARAFAAATAVLDGLGCPPHEFAIEEAA